MLVPNNYSKADEHEKKLGNQRHKQGLPICSPLFLETIPHYAKQRPI